MKVCLPQFQALIPKVVRELTLYDLNVDSLGMMEMLLEAEKKFGTEFDIAKLTYAPWEI